MLQRRPAADLPDHTGQQLAGIRQRPDIAARDRHLRDRLALAKRGVGSQKIVQARLVSGSLPVGNMLRCSASKNIAAETVTVDEPTCSLAHGLQALQAES
jgi:hypothetical protein